MQYTIIVDKQPRTNPSTEKKTYKINIEELRIKGDIYDSLVITKDEDYVMRRLSLSEFHVLNVLDEPIKEPIPDLNIELFEGDNYIYLLDEIGNKFYAEYLVKNDFNDIYVTVNQMKSAINSTAQSIELNVNQKLTGYSTTEEMKAAILAKANEINLELEKKVDDETITGAYLILKINGDTSEAKLNADKVELSANDVLNLLAGNTINLSSNNITISSDCLNIDEKGNINLKDPSSGSTGITILNWNEKLKAKLGSFGLKVSRTDSSTSVTINSNNIAVHNETLGSYMNKEGIETSGYVHADGEVTGSNISSDKRLKKNIKDSDTNAIETILKIKHREFEWKKDEKHVNTGYIAQEIEKIDKNFILKIEVRNKKGKIIDYKYYVNMLPILATATKAIQEQQGEIEQQNKTIESLIKRVESLEREVANGNNRI